ncbi:hypothetical protein [Aquimarina aquimarini]|uniref:hypothetical protein n=1 Tax=Aquimarina aquimarini TaxID=1191734 RepID=UPI000D557C9D|nr:hypothetical protein [Aquimarina aquimarini]
MKKVFSLLIFVILFVSCNDTDKTESKQTNDKNITNDVVEFNDITLLNDKVSTLNSELNLLKTELEDIKKRQEKDDSHTELYYKNVILRNIDKDTVELIRQVNHGFHLSEQNDILRSFTNNKSSFDNSFLANEKWRDAGFIDSFFSEDVINMIVYLFYKNNTYESSRLNLYVNSLIETYETIDQKDKIVLEELYKLSEIGYFEKEKEINQLLHNLNDLNKDIYESEFDDYVSGMTGVFNVYSFWARRYNEKNDEIVYEVLKKIQNKMRTKN